nr:MAG TPA: hypothetical protein [Caudoviricetes sp.]
MANTRRSYYLKLEPSGGQSTSPQSCRDPNG